MAINDWEICCERAKWANEENMSWEVVTLSCNDMLMISRKTQILEKFPSELLQKTVIQWIIFICHMRRFGTNFVLVEIVIRN